MNKEELRKVWNAEEQAGFLGWDFSHLDGRWESEPLPWDYKTLVNTYRKPDNKLLDMGTGGGEFLLTINHPYQNTSVTESWEPNYNLCKERLEPLGICVKKVFDDLRLPFDDNAFDIVINRHESYDLSEVRRILKPDGFFITQQVGGTNDTELSMKLIYDFKPAYPGFDLEHQSEAFRRSGFKILFSDEIITKLKFYDTGAAVYFVKLIPWEFPGFSVDKCFDKLLGLNTELESNGFISSNEHRFIIAAKNNK